MSQMRLDPLTGRWVVVSTLRAQRPTAFVVRSAPVEADSERPCPFCPGQEDASVTRYELRDHDGNWKVRIVSNRYPAFEGDEPFVVANRGPVFTQATAGGIHEVLILSPDHEAPWSALSDDQAAAVMTAMGARIAEHSTRDNLRYAQAIVNSGREAGASVAHPHGQLLGLSFVPREVAEEQARIARFTERCLLCTTLEAEESDGVRVIYRDESVVVICPFWSANPYEMLVIPRDHDPHLHAADATALADTGIALRRCLSSLVDAVGEIAYNVVFHSAPFRASQPYHWHVHVWPKTTTRAGFEMGTGVAINIVNPEDAAELLRVGASAR